MRVGFVGLGAMGSAMAGVLLKAGHEVIAWNRTPARAQALRERGASVAGSPAEAARAGVVLSMVADDGAIRRWRRGRTASAPACPRGACTCR